MSICCGFSRLESLVALVVIAVVAGIFLQRVIELQEDAERLHMEAVARSLVTALQLQQAEMIFAGQEGNIRSLAGSNPFSLLENPPGDYQGGCGPDGVPVRPGWCFDGGKGVVVFQPSVGRYLKAERLPTFQVALVQGSEKAVIVPPRVALVLLYYYKWVGATRAPGRFGG